MLKLFLLILFFACCADTNAQFLDKVKKTVKDVTTSTTNTDRDVKDLKRNLDKTKSNVGSISKNIKIIGKNVPKTSKQKSDSVAFVSKLVNPNEELVYFTDFSFEDNSWKNYDNKSSYQPIKTELNNGTYVVTNGTRNPIWSVKELGLDLNRDFVIETAIALVSGSETDSYGINFAQRGNYYPNNAVGINLKGYYSIFERTNGSTVKNFVDFTATDAIAQARAKYNKIRLEKVGRKINLFINDIEVSQEASWTKPVLFFGNYLGFYAGAGQEIKANYFIVKYIKGSDAATVVNTNAAPPKIKIAEPRISNSGSKINYTGKSILITGNVSSEDAVYQFTVNGRETPLDEKGNFTAYYALQGGSNTIRLEAKDGNAKTTNFDFIVNQNSPQVKNIADQTRGIKVTDKATNTTLTVGNYYALIIAAQNYQDPYFPTLGGPIKDGAALIEVLRDKYGFENKRIFFVKDPTRQDVFRAFDSVRKIITPNDNVLIFYAGHGDWKEEYKQGYWAPVDAGSSSQYTMISNPEIKSAINAISSKHTLLITDACFAGGMFVGRSALSDASRAITEIYKLPARKAITSGTLTVVPDKSVFMEYLLKKLKENDEKYLPALQLFTSFSMAVTNNSPNAQLPQYGTIQETGDEGGDFVFIVK